MLTWLVVRQLAFSCVVLWGALAFAGSVRAQEVVHDEAAEPNVEAPATTGPMQYGLDPTAPITLRPETEFRRLTTRVAVVLARRTGVPVEVGSAPPSALLAAVPAAHIAIGRRNGQLAIVLAGNRGLLFAMDIDVPRNANETAVRELALAIESLRDTAIEPTSPPAAVVPGEGGAPVPREVTRWRVVNHEPTEDGGTAWGVRRDDRLPTAKPIIYMRALLGYSPVRERAIVALGTGLGLCIRDQCIVFEADVPLLVESRTVSGFLVRYRFFDFAARIQYRPWHFETFTPGFNLGIVMRIASGEVTGAGGASSTTSDFGVRGSAEMAWRFHNLFELVLEAGVDYAVDRSTFVNRDGNVLIAGDRWTPWLITSLRLRPR
ncbi:MAG: hypothetical protein IPK60_16595 [Sandaracinaceae bacterium]|nr:hypothetical protein [Sandaracinaceae bacterium]